MPFFRGFYRIRLPKHGRPDIPLLLMIFLRWFPWLFVFGLTITTQPKGSSFAKMKFRIGLNKNKLLRQNFHQYKIKFATAKHPSYHSLEMFDVPKNLSISSHDFPLS